MKIDFESNDNERALVYRADGCQLYSGGACVGGVRWERDGTVIDVCTCLVAVCTLRGD